MHTHRASVYFLKYPRDCRPTKLIMPIDTGASILIDIVSMTSAQCLEQLNKTAPEDCHGARQLSQTTFGSQLKAQSHFIHNFVHQIWTYSSSNYH